MLYEVADFPKRFKFLEQKRSEGPSEIENLLNRDSKNGIVVNDFWIGIFQERIEWGKDSKDAGGEEKRY